ALGAALTGVTTVGRDRGLDFVRVEPVADVAEADLTRFGARRAPAVQPRHTWVIDLEPEESALSAQLTAGQRRNVRAAERKGLTFRRSRDPADANLFLALIGGTGARSGFRPHSDDYYRTLLEILMPLGAGCLHLAEADGRAVAAVIEFTFGDTSYYGHAAADIEMNRRLRASAPLVWSIMMQAKAAGRRHFDFWGILPEHEADHPWAGFSRFKKSFGGRLVRRAGTWEVPLKPVKYHLYTQLRRWSGRRGEE
ncbi:MAG: lipid II:glycine glycyltransferase FemX, partial [Candidatus Dormibacteria bacterium]